MGGERGGRENGGMDEGREGRREAKLPPEAHTPEAHLRV